MDEMLKIAKKVKEIERVSLKVYDIMKEFNFYDVEEATVQDLTKDLLDDPYSVIGSLTEIIERLSDDLDTEREKVDFAISEATKKIKADTEVKCDHDNFFQVTVNGKLLTREQLDEIGEYRQACKNAWLLEEVYDIKHEDSLEMGYNVMLNMLNDEAYEKALDKVLEQKRAERIKQIHNTLADMYGELFNIASPSEIESELNFVQDAIKNTTINLK